MRKGFYCLLVLLLSGIVSISAFGQGRFMVTWVEGPDDCSGNVPCGGQRDWDGDSSCEDPFADDSDALYGTIQEAVNDTKMGGEVIILQAGSYHEAVTFPRSMTLKGPSRGAAVIDGSCSDPQLSVGLNVGGATVRVEGVTVRGFTSAGITVSSGGLAILADVEIILNTGDGIRISNGDAQIHKCRIYANGDRGRDRA